MKTRSDSITVIPRMEYILGLLVALVVADGLITNFVVGSGFAEEVNPFLRPFVGSINLLLLKLAGGLLSALILWRIYKRRPKLTQVVTLIFIAFYVGIVYWNLAIFFITQA